MYLQAVLEVYLTAQARERVANYRELLLEKVLELVGDVSEYQSRRGGSQDGMEGNGGMTTEDVLVRPLPSVTVGSVKFNVTILS